ncbi:hypothetical protein J3R82DRAFT_815 [Butyriboletus roseoflavus]|nr:hypothetical protein J3R82DRAFT_815 [Butyriboletus roseoflavus]
MKAKVFSSVSTYASQASLCLWSCLLKSTFNFYTGADPTKFARSLLREFTGTDTRPLQRTSDVSLSIHKSISNKASPSFVDEQTAFADGLAYVTSDNKVIMKGDNTTLLSEGVNRSR